MCARVRQQGWTIKAAADAAGVSMRCCSTWLKRWDAGQAMTDRSSRPRSTPTRTTPTVEGVIERLRRQRWTSTRIAGTLGLPTSTVCAVLKRIGLNRLWRLEAPEAYKRYCRPHPRGLLHLALKKTRRFQNPGHRV